MVFLFTLVKVVATLKAEYINPFLEASESVLKAIANIEISLGKVYLRTSPYTGNVLLIIIGLVGNLKGQVIFSMDQKVACQIASAMMAGMPVQEMDEISQSAVSEAANMILGNAATKLFALGLKIDITPPSLVMGENLQVSTQKTKALCVPLNLGNDKKIELNFVVEA